MRRDDQIDSISKGLRGKPFSFSFNFITYFSPVKVYSYSFWNIFSGSKGILSPALNSFCSTLVKVLITMASVSFLAYFS